MVLLTSHSVPTEGIQHSEPNVTLNVEESDVGVGTLYITESYVLWLNAQDTGLQLEYKLISLHAISRDLQAFPREHLLCHYEGKLPGLNREVEGSGDEDENENENDAESQSQLVEIRFTPENTVSLEAMFEALANCQTLHPDSDCQLSGEEDFEDAEEDGSGDAVIYDTENGMDHLSEQGRINLERMNQMLGSGQGDADILARTNQLNIANGHHNEDDQMEADQFQDADDANGQS